MSFTVSSLSRRSDMRVISELFINVSRNLVTLHVESASFLKSMPTFVSRLGQCPASVSLAAVWTQPHSDACCHSLSGLVWHLCCLALSDICLLWSWSAGNYWLTGGRDAVSESVECVIKNKYNKQKCLRTPTVFSPQIHRLVFSPASTCTGEKYRGRPISGECLK